MSDRFPRASLEGPTGGSGSSDSQRTLPAIADVGRIAGPSSSSWGGDISAYRAADAMPQGDSSDESPTQKMLASIEGIGTVPPEIVHKLGLIGDALSAGPEGMRMARLDNAGPEGQASHYVVARPEGSHKGYVGAGIAEARQAQRDDPRRTLAETVAGIASKDWPNGMFGVLNEIHAGVAEKSMVAESFPEATRIDDANRWGRVAQSQKDRGLMLVQTGPFDGDDAVWENNPELEANSAYFALALPKGPVLVDLVRKRIVTPAPAELDVLLPNYRVEPMPRVPDLQY